MRLFTHVLTICLVSISIFAYSQDESTSAPKANAFSLHPDNLKALSSSVNLMTGDLALPLSLATLPSKNGLSINFAINYSSAVEGLSDRSNKDSPTSALGLGWSMPQSQIIVNNKNTGTRDDDDFYMFENGSSVQLYCVSTDKYINTYKSKVYQNWSIQYFKSAEKWEITKDDGTVFVYGDQNTGRNTVQYLVKWSNWMGHSTKTTGQQRQPMIWDLAEIRGLWGDKINFTYAQVNQAVGTGGSQHTEASYLDYIQDSWGNALDLVYGNKNAAEVVEPHVEKLEPDAYQERYETKFLDKVLIFAENVKMGEVRFTYDVVGTGVLSKRRLLSVSQVTALEQSQKMMSFEYLTTGAMKGSMNKIVTAMGGSVSFEYSTGQSISTSLRTLPITAPSGYGAPQVYMADDFIVVTWREWPGGSAPHATGVKNIKVRVYAWEGRWIETILPDVSGIKLHENNVQSHKIAVGKNFFGLLKPDYSGDLYTLNLYRYDETKAGEWIVDTRTIDVGPHDFDDTIIGAGDEYIGVSARQGNLQVFTWEGTEWAPKTFTEDEEDHGAGFGHNYILSHATSGDDELTMYVLNEKKQWQIIPQSLSYTSSAGIAKVITAPAFAFNLRLGENEALLRWNEEYKIQAPYDVPFNKSPQVHVTSSMLTAFNYEGMDPGFARAFRFDGVNWNDSGSQQTHGKGSEHSGEDIMTWGKNEYSWHSLYYKAFDPNTLTWGGNNNIEIRDANNWAHTQGLGVESIFSLNTVRYKGVAGWELNQITTQGLVPYIAVTDYNLETLITIPSTQYMLRGDYDPEPYFFRNGKLDFSLTGSTLPGRHAVALNSLSFWDLSNENSFVLMPATSGVVETAMKMTSMTLYRVGRFKAIGTQTDYPISKITVDNGEGTLNYTSVEYDVTNAVFDPTLYVANYNKVTVVPGSQTVSTKPYGSIEHYFFNGIKPQTLGEAFSGDMLNRYKMFTGMMYRSITKNSGGSPVSTTNNFYETYSSDIEDLTWDNPRDVEIAYGVRQYKSTTLIDNVTYVSDYFFNATTKNQVSAVDSYTISGATTSEKTRYETKYWWEVYDQTRRLTLLTPVAQTTSLLNGSVVGSEVTRYKDWVATASTIGTVPAPVDSYAWRSGSSVFVDWESHKVPTGTWVYRGKVQLRDAQSGAVIEQRSAGDESTVKILDKQKNKVLAEVTNAVNQDVAFTGFDDGTLGNFTQLDPSLIIVSGGAKTGSKFLELGSAGISKLNLVPSKSYVVSFWAKSAGGMVTISEQPPISLNTSGAWVFVQMTVKNLSLIKINRVGATAVAIDEVRIHPTEALMASYSYHPLFGITSKSDPNNKIVYTKYDAFGRVIGTLNDEGDLVQSQRYHFKQ